VFKLMSGLVGLARQEQCARTRGSPPLAGVGAQRPADGQASGEAWGRLSCGDGAKGRRVYDWAVARLPAVEEFDGEGTDPSPVGPGVSQRGPPRRARPHLAHVPTGTRCGLVRVAGRLVAEAPTVHCSGPFRKLTSPAPSTGSPLARATCSLRRGAGSRTLRRR